MNLRRVGAQHAHQRRVFRGGEVAERILLLSKVLGLVRKTH